MLATHSGFWPTVVCVVPLYLTYRAYVVYMQRVERQVAQMSQLHLATVEALALAIDAKDQTTHDHLRRVQAYAVGLARSFGMSDSDIQAVQTAALLHDIGKLAIPEHILSKPGPLTPQEFQKSARTRRSERRFSRACRSRIPSRRSSSRTTSAGTARDIHAA